MSVEKSFPLHSRIPRRIPSSHYPGSGVNCPLLHPVLFNFLLQSTAGHNTEKYLQYLGYEFSEIIKRKLFMNRPNNSDDDDDSNDGDDDDSNDGDDDDDGNDGDDSDADCDNGKMVMIVMVKMVIMMVMVLNTDSNDSSIHKLFEYEQLCQ
ncbi:hypothetical protein FHG87_025595 [Trinorchestia longiramus]|nr:hypothetical protein FHG87_025595 [Trinorchestia longiramus]